MEKESKKKTNISPLNLVPPKLQCPPPPIYKLPNGLSYYPTKPNLQGSSSIYHSLKDGMTVGVGSSLGKELVNLQRENPQINKCDFLKLQIQDCIQTDFFCNHLFESYLIQCSL